MAGQIGGMIKEIRPVREIIENILREAFDTINKVSATVKEE